MRLSILQCMVCLLIQTSVLDLFNHVLVNQMNLFVLQLSLHLLHLTICYNTEFITEERQQQLVLHPSSWTHPSIHPLPIPAVFSSGWSLCQSALVKRLGNTQSRSAIYHRITQFHTHIHTSGKVSGCSEPDLHVFGLQEEAGAPRGKAL